MPLTQWDDLGQTLGLDRANESLSVGVQIWASRRKLHRFDARGFQDRAERCREKRVSIVDEVAVPIQKSLSTISEIPRDLIHPLAIRSRKDPGNLDPPGLEINDEENEIPNQARPRNHFNAEEVRCCDTRKRCFLPRTELSERSPKTSPVSGSG